MRDGQGRSFWKADEIGENASLLRRLISYEHKGFKLELEICEEVDNYYVDATVFSPSGKLIRTPFLDLRVLDGGWKSKNYVNLRAFREFVDACLSL